MLIVTIAALLMAASLGWFAYRLMQDEQRRSDARVALLTAALDDEAPWPVPPIAAAERVPVAAPVSPLDQERMRTGSGPRTRGSVNMQEASIGAGRQEESAPCIVFLEDDDQKMGAFPSEHDEPAHAPRTRAFVEDDVLEAPLHREALDDRSAGSTTRASGLFADVPEMKQGNPRAALALTGVVLVGALAAGYAWFGGGEAPAAVSSRPAPSATAAQPETTTSTGLPLDLVSLAHERRDGVLMVRGVVRNPAAASVRTGVVANVVLLDRDGRPLGAARAPLAGLRLRPGTETSFTLQVAAPDNLRRYRVTFRDANEVLVPHADRRSGGRAS